MERYNKIVGNLGEQVARNYLTKNGYKILSTNYSCKFGEIDIVALDEECLVFVEVKTRTTDRYGHPENAVNYWKKKHLELTARSYIDYKRMGNYVARFDVVEVFAKYDDNKFIPERINVIKNII